MQTEHDSVFPGHPRREWTDEYLRDVIDSAAQFLPAQGPITSFVHQNTLHAFEDQSFIEAVEAGAVIYGCNPYFTEERYRRELERGRIRFEDLQWALRDQLGNKGAIGIAPNSTRFDLRLSMLKFLHPIDSPEEIQWYMAEIGALSVVRPGCVAAVKTRLISETQQWITRENMSVERGLPAEVTELMLRTGQAFSRDFGSAAWESFMLQCLWHVCLNGMREAPAFVPAPPAPLRHRDLIVQATGSDTDSWVNDVLIRFCAAFLDQGIAHAAFPERERGMFTSFCKLYRQQSIVREPWMDGVARELARLEDSATPALESIRESLLLLGVAESEWKPFLTATFLSLRGWGGMVRQMEMHGDSVVHPLARGSLIDLLAIRMLLERFALAYAGRVMLKYDGPLCGLREEALRQAYRQESPCIEKRAFEVFQMAQIIGWSPVALHALSQREWARLIEEIEGFSSVERRRVFHLAYEKRFMQQALDVFSLHKRRRRPDANRPRFQAIFCIDEREESFRRHLEEVEPDSETFGAPAYFHVPMYFRAAGATDFLRLSPASIPPAHWVVEELEATQGVRPADPMLSPSPRPQSMLSRLWNRAYKKLGSLASSLPIAIPGWGTEPLSTGDDAGTSAALTRLVVEREQKLAGDQPGCIGFTLSEMIEAADRLLQETGLTSNFAPCILLVGHGSQSLNNPHDSAYNCGACGGGSSGPNARVAAQFLNDARVRKILKQRGISIPCDTLFVGAHHNTCTDALTCFDLHRLAQSQRDDFEVIRKKLETTSNRNAHERCRRFGLAKPLTYSFTEARRHVQERARDLAELRPELGHAGNALCVIGRRELTRGLFLDRRAFLVSYDPMQDDEDFTQLAHTLRSVLPICAGINLEYYFSSIDATGWGAGTKLPHNITGLVGVMDGAASDLRTGLPWQLVDVHEPVRLMVVVEAKVSSLNRILDHDAGLARLCRNEWVLVAALDPFTDKLYTVKTSGVQEYSPSVPEMPRSTSSLNWYRGWSENLDFAEIDERPGAALPSVGVQMAIPQGNPEAD